MVSVFTEGLDSISAFRFDIDLKYRKYSAQHGGHGMWVYVYDAANRIGLNVKRIGHCVLQTRLSA